jgi:hypothetical protein
MRRQPSVHHLDIPTPGLRAQGTGTTAREAADLDHSALAAARRVVAQ